MEVGSFTFAKSLHCAHGWEESYFFKGKGFSPLSLFFLGGHGILCGPSCPWPHRPLSPGTGVIGVWGHTWQSFASCVLGFIKVLRGRTTANFQDEWPKPKGPILVWFNWADGYCRREGVLGHTSIGVRRSWTLAIQILACDHILSFQSSNPEMQIATITDQWKEQHRGLVQCDQSGIVQRPLFWVGLWCLMREINDHHPLLSALGTTCLLLSLQWIH